MSSGAGAGYPHLPKPEELAAAGPRAAKARVTKLASRLPARELAPFFEQACRELAGAGETELAAWAFAQARKAEKAHPSVLDLDRLQPVFLELVPAGSVAPAALRDYAATLSEHLAPAQAHARFRAVICAGFDAGMIPYARIFPDLRRLARAAKIKKRDEEEFLAERLLRAGVLPRASHAIWAAAKEPLAVLAGHDAELMRQLIAAEPDHDRHQEESGAEVAEQIRQMWLETLAEAGAGARLRAEWFHTTGRRCAAAVLLKLVHQAGERLFPEQRPAEWADADSDPALMPAAAGAEAAGALDDLGAGHLPGLSAGLTVLLKPENAELLEQHAGHIRDLAIPDPVDALLAVLRLGIPAELGVPAEGSQVEQRYGRTSVLQHHGYLTIGACSWNGYATVQAEGFSLTERLRSLPEELTPWYDGHVCLLSRQRDGRWETFRADGQVGDGLALTLEPGTATARPQAPGSAEVIFPGASEPSVVRLRRGMITVTAPGGTQTARLAFSPYQSGKGGVVPPPGWWPQRKPVDPAGSAVLRGLGREAAERLLLAALRGPVTVRKELARLLPGRTAAELVEGVVAAARTAADCLLRIDRLRHRVGLPPVPPMSELVEVRADLPVGEDLGRLVSLRLLADDLKAGAGEGTDPAEPLLLRVVELPPWQYLLSGEFGRLAGYAYAAVWAWNSSREATFDMLSAWAGSPCGDGSGRWRLLELASTIGRRRSAGELWRTPNGALLVLHKHNDKKTAAVEYAPEASFEPIELPGWELEGDPIPQGWISPERVPALRWLLAERGPAPADAGKALELAERTGMGTLAALRLCFGDRLGWLPTDRSAGGPGRPPGDARRLPREITQLVRAAGEDQRGHGLSYPEVDLLREQLITEDPAALWTSGPDIARAAAWWLAFKGSQGG